MFTRKRFLPVAAVVLAAVVGGTGPAMAAGPTSGSGSAQDCPEGAFCVWEDTYYRGTRHVLERGNPYKDIGAARTIHSLSAPHGRHVCLIKWENGRRVNTSVEEGGAYPYIRPTRGTKVDALGDNC